MRWARIAADVARLDRKGAACALDQRRAAHQRGDARAVERRRHDEQPQVLAQALLRVERQREAEIGVERAFVEFVEQHRGDARRATGSSRIMRANTPSVTTSIRVPRRDQALQPHAQADRLADLLAERRRHALAPRRARRAGAARARRSCPCGEGFVEQRQRHARRLAGAGRRDQHRARPGAERGNEPRQGVVDRQRFGESAHRASIQRGPSEARRLIPSPVREKSLPPGLTRGWPA